MMDWYAWLSQTSLDASLIYEYGLALVRNEVEEEDIPFFNHDFLQSLGISIAKHRLEILKLCRKNAAAAATNAGGLSRLVLVMNKTRKLFARKLGFHRSAAPPEMSPYRGQWSGALRRIAGAGGREGRNVMWSGPLDRRLMAAARCQSSTVSGPLDVRVHERVLRSPMAMVGTQRQRQTPGLVCRSPNLSGPIERHWLSPSVGYYDADADADADAAQSLWSIMFQDMKPT